MNGDVVAGLVGSAIGVLGGAIGTYFSITNTKSPEERRFMIHASLAVWLAVSLFLAAVFLLPRPWIDAVRLLYVISLIFVIHYINRRQAAIRQPGSNR